VLIQPATLYILSAVKVFNIRLYIKKRCLIQHIHLAEIQLIRFYFLDLYHRKPNVIRPMQTSNCEYPMLDLL